MSVAGVALLPPVDAAVADSLASHMVQHVMLISVAAPLLGAGLPQLERRRPALLATATLVLQAMLMAAWHAPVFYEAALRHDAIHAVEHLSLLGTATAFWWALDLRRPDGGAVAFVYAAALPGSALGAAMTLARTPWYRSYPSLPGQQLAGVVMWAFAGLAYVVAGAAVFALWLARTQRESAG